MIQQHKSSIAKMQRTVICLGGLFAIGLIAWFGAAAIGQQVWQAAWIVPIAVALHALQLLLSAIAWREVAGLSHTPLLLWWRVRWIREAVNSTLPVAQIGGSLAAIRLLVHEHLSAPLCSAATTVDIAMEAVSQVIFTVAGLGLLTAVSPDQHWLPWFAGGTTLLIIGVIGFAVALRLGLMRAIERLPGFSVWLGGLDVEMRRLARDHLALFRGASLHLLAWLIGCGETWLGLTAMGVASTCTNVVIIESLAMAARSIGFAVPGSLGVQESGYILVCGLFGVPPDTAVALSMVKRARELLVGVGGLLDLQRYELSRKPTGTIS